MQTAFVVRNTFLWCGAFLGPFAGPRARLCRASGPALDVDSHTAVVSRSALGPVRSPQPQPRFASRARRRSPDSATFQRETRAHQRATIPHAKSRFRTLRCPTRPKPTRAVSGTAPKPIPFGTDLGWRPEGAHRTGRNDTSWLCVLRRRGRLCLISNTPLSLTRDRPNLKRFVQPTGSTEALLLTARANGLGGPKSRGAFEPHESSNRGATPSSRDAPMFRRTAPLEVEAWGHPHAFFTSRPNRP